MPKRYTLPMTARVGKIRNRGFTQLLMPVLENNSGFTFIEVVISLTVFSVLIGLVTLNLLNIKHQASLTTSVTTFITDFKAQQLKAMIGDTEGRGTETNYGIYLGQSQYTLFHGSAYNPSDTSNFSPSLGDNIQFTNPGLTLIFTAGSGELSAGTTITIKNILSNQKKTISINQLGVITGVN